MRVSSILTLVIATFVVSGNVLAGEALLPLAKKAVNGTDIESIEAVKKLRNSGPEGLKALFDTYAAEIGEFRSKGTETDKWRKIAAALDSVAMQKDAYASALYWYTDLDDAKRASSETKRPILTLRLLGNLNEEFSCANSRLFRSLLYANADVSRYLRDNYILHWKSVRPAPRITIDFGDGRKIERTITGNSIHYVLDDDGRIIEALPGLYSPQMFYRYLAQAKQVSDAVDGKAPRARSIEFMRYRKQSFDGLREAREKAGRDTKIQPGDKPQGGMLASGDAFAAAPRAVTKMMVTDELSLLRVYDRFYQFAPLFGFDDWARMAGSYVPSWTHFDDASTAFVRRQVAKNRPTEAELGRMFDKLRRSVQIDTTRNDFVYHTQLYTWLNDDPTVDVEIFNTRVYAEIFLTPDSDQWLGLYSTDVYTALDGNGIIK